MFDLRAKVAVIGEKDMVFAFKALGFKTYSPRDLDEARDILNSLERDNVALCFLHQSYFKTLQEAGQDGDRLLIVFEIPGSRLKDLDRGLGVQMKVLVRLIIKAGRILRGRGQK